MVATLVQSVSNQTPGATSLAIGSAQGWVAPTAGNLIVAWANSDSTVTINNTMTAGPSVVDSNAVYLWWKVATGTETAFTFTPAASDTLAAGLFEYSGLAAAPTDVQNAAPATTGSSGTTVPSLSVTATGASGDLAIAVAGLHGNGAASSAPVWTGGFTNRQTMAAGTVGANAYVSTFVADFQNAAAATITTSCSWTGANVDRNEVMIAFKLAAVTAPSAPPPGILYIGPTRG